MKTPGIRFIVTSLCNYDCTYCHNEWEPKEKPSSKLEKDLIHELISAAKTLGAQEVDITGGEPLLKMDRVQTILTAAQEQNLWTNITTNGYFLPEYYKTLANSGLKELHIHIPSLNHATYQAMMQGNANLEKVLEGIELARATFPVVKANIPIEEGKNNHEIPAFLDYFSVRGIIPRFIETMSTQAYDAKDQQAFDQLIGRQLGKPITPHKSYLWGINEYESDGKPFETLRCICFDRKCDICPETNFIHVDQEYHIRPCNLRSFRIKAVEGETNVAMQQALQFLSQQTDIPETYKQLWGQAYVPLRTGETSRRKSL